MRIADRVLLAEHGPYTAMSAVRLGTLAVLAFTRSGPGVLHVDSLRPEWRLIDYALLPPMSVGLADRFDLPMSMLQLATRTFTLEFYGYAGTFGELAQHPWAKWGKPLIRLNRRGDHFGLNVPVYVEMSAAL